MKNNILFAVVAVGLSVSACKSGDAPKERFMFTGKTDPQVEKLLAGTEIYADAQRVIPVIVNSDPTSGAKKRISKGTRSSKREKFLTLTR
jgi:hypothetical protein